MNGTTTIHREKLAKLSQWPTIASTPGDPSKHEVICLEENRTAAATRATATGRREREPVLAVHSFLFTPGHI